MPISQQFNRGTDEGFYGLGQHQNGQMNYNGEDVLLSQHNMDVAIPFVVSTLNYGLLWDNNSVTRFGESKPYTYAGAPMTVCKSMAVAAGPQPTASTARPSKTQRTHDPASISRRCEPLAPGTRTADMQQTVPGLHVTWQGTIVSQAAACTASACTAPAISSCSSMAARCSTAGGRTGIPSTIISTSSSPPVSRTSMRDRVGSGLGLYRASARQSPFRRRSPFADALIRFRAMRSIIISSRARAWTR